MAQAQAAKITQKDLKATDPRWCTGCGDYMILVGLRKMIVQEQIQPNNIVNVSGIGCSGRIPHYLNTYGVHSIHGRSIPVATGIALARPDLKLFLESGDGDSLSIGGNHLIHGMHKNINCVYLLFDNQIYGLTKDQTSPTTQQGLPTNTQPLGSYLEPLNPIEFALGLKCSFVAGTAEWLGDHMVATINAAFKHKGFSFVHVAQRCPKYNPAAWNYQSSDWFTFLTHENGIAPDAKVGKEAKTAAHDPSDLGAAFARANDVQKCFGLFYRNEAKTCYEDVLRAKYAAIKKQPRSSLLDRFRI